MYCYCSQGSNLINFPFTDMQYIVVDQWLTFIINQDTVMVNHESIGDLMAKRYKPFSKHFF